ncbi:pilus assembly protein N-terminal domain-containing protein [soil metagenome]
MRRLSLALCACLISLGATAASAQSARTQSGSTPLTVGAGQAVRMSLNAPVRDLVVGDPAVADVSLINDRTLVILGKKVGATTVLAFDARGQALADRQIVVSGTPAGGVVVQRGAASATYACSASCSPLPAAEPAK